MPHALSLRAPAAGEEMPPAATVPELGASEFRAIAAMVQADARIHLVPAKKSLIQSRLARRLRERGLGSFGDYVRLAQTDDRERAAMVIALTTNHTSFFRETHHFDHLRSAALPWLRERGQRQPLRIWSAGCSSGEEAYTIAMCLLGPDRSAAAWLRHVDLKLLATDLNPRVVEAARQAVYPAASAQAVPPRYRAAWMRPHGADYRVAEEARALVSARVLNLFGRWPMRHQYDIIFCRNVMIYFDDSAKAELEARFADLLVPGGYLYIGHSERLIGPAAQRMLPCGQTVYRLKGGA